LTFVIEDNGPPSDVPDRVQGFFVNTCAFSPIMFIGLLVPLGQGNFVVHDG
jgi:hypothetical protein